MNINELKAEEAQLREKLHANTEKQRKLNQIALVEKYGFDVGDTIEYKLGPQDSHVYVAKIVGFGGQYDDQFYYVSAINKDGNASRLQRKLYHTEAKAAKLLKKA